MNYNSSILARLTLLTTLFLFITGCSLLQGTPNLGDLNTFPRESTVYLVCSAECLSQAQCGTVVEDNSQVVFGNQSGPATKSHSLFAPNNTVATIRQSRQETLVLESNPTSQTSTLNFYRLSFDNGGVATEAWVAGWCVGDRMK